MNEAERAVSCFAQGGNCAQAVLCAYAPHFGLAPEMAMRLAAPFGGGMARLGETCGAVTGALMVIGLQLGNATAEDQESKERTYQLVREFVQRFAARHGSVKCRELLGCDLSTPEGLQQAREQGLSTKLCRGFVRDSAQIVAELLFT
ncbi:MAG: C_GCAxxG_C_C family protein [Chloroflexi bacterium]|nr:C_GCAxxG_C_C family protein [Chloroflexota bacterium]